MNKREYSRPKMERFQPVRNITLLTKCCPFEQPIHPKRGHAVFAG